MKVLEIVKQVVKNPKECTLVMRYFTLWAMLLHTLGYDGIDRKLLAQIVSVSGFYFTFVHPRKLIIPMRSKTIQIKGCELAVIDLVTHHLPYIIQIVRNKKYSMGAKAKTLGLVALYMCVNDPRKVYSIRNRNVGHLALLNACVYFL